MTAAMKSLFPGFLCVVLLAPCLSGCGLLDDDQEKRFAPPNCQRDRPRTGFLTVQVTINAENPGVPVTIYRGDIEDGVIDAEDLLTTPEGHVELDVDHRYSAVARYLSGADTVFVADAASLEAESEDYTDATCWYVGRAEVDVRLVSP